MPEPKIKREIEQEDGPEDDVQDHAFLGRELLTWLVWRVAREDATFEDDNGEMTFAFGGRVRLVAAAGDVSDAVLKGRAPAQSIELMAGIGAGRTLREAELRVVRGEREFRFTLVAETLDLKGVKLPSVLKDESDDRLGDRMALLEELESCIHAAFQTFLRERTRPVWQRTIVPEIRAWLAGGLEVTSAG